MIPSFKNLSNHTKWMALFGLWSLHGVVAFWQFQDVSLNESSLPYIMVRMFLLAWITINFTFITFVYKNASPWLKLREILVRPKLRDYLLIAAASLFFLRVCLWIFQGLLVQPLRQQVGGYIDLLSPVLDLTGYVSFEIVTFILFINLHATLEYKKLFQKFISSAIVFFSILGLIVVVISMTGLGILSSYRGDWQRGLPAVALLEWQILLACAFCLVMLFVESKKRIIEIPHFDIWICIAVWLGACMLWLSQPVIPNASALKPHEPNFEIYPFNDAQTYDEFAQSAIVGNGFGESRIPQRPLYIIFLGFMHVLVGQGYNDMVFVQSLVFAIFPVLLYLLGKEFLGRPIGISIALIAVLRDYTSNIVSPFTGNVSYSKLYLSEIPTAIFLILFLLIGMRWVKTGFPLFSGFLLGGILGIAMLIRTQVIVALPIILLFAILALPQKIRPLLRSSLLVLLTIILVVSPWLLRNWRMTNELIFDSPESQTANLALRYSRLNGVDVDIMPQLGETNSEYNNRLKATAWDAISSNPWGAVWAVTNSFMNHNVNNILLFPLRNDLKTIGELWSPTDAFWEKWEGTPTFLQSLLLVFYIFLFGLGLTTAWIRNSWLGLLPLALNLAYNLWTSLALLSGQRFMLTMDWSIYMYYMIGLFTLFSGFLFALDRGRLVIVEWVKANTFVMTRPVTTTQCHKYLIFGFLFFGVGLSLPIGEIVFPDKYPSLSQNEVITGLLATSSLDQLRFNSACLQKLADSNELSFTQGRAIYPRYYDAGDGESFTDSVGYKAVSEGRLVFNLVGQMNGRFIFKTSQQPDFFPHASDVTLISSKIGELWFVHVKQDDKEKVYVSESFDPSICP